jgi:ATP-binding cassette subfamily B protein
MDEIVVISGGRVIERGSHEELLAKNGIYRRLWDDQSHTPRAADQAGQDNDDDDENED